MTEEQLAQLAIQGDRVALEELIAKVYPAIHRFYRKLTGGAQDAQDFTQAAMVRMMENLHRYRASPNQKFLSWLFRVSYNLYIDVRRKKKPLLVEMDTLNQTPDHRNDHVQVEARDQVDALLAELTEDMRAMVVLRYYMDFSYKEIAKATGNSEQRVKWRLHDAMGRMRKQMEVEQR